MLARDGVRVRPESFSLVESVMEKRRMAAAVLKSFAAIPIESRAIKDGHLYSIVGLECAIKKLSAPHISPNSRSLGTCVTGAEETPRHQR